MKYVIGDIHGEYKKLKLLIENELNSISELIFIGDYIDKGNESKDVIEYLLKLDETYNCIFLKGNHEYMFLKALNKQKKAIDFMEDYGGIATLKSYLKDKYSGNMKQDFQRINKIMDDQHLEFIFNTDLYYENNKFLIIHAGINPDNVDLNENNEDLFFIRNKFIKSREKIKNKRIIFGHTAFKKPYFDLFKIGIDTGATYKEYGKLTAYSLQEGICINHLGEIFKDPYFKN
jgi:serine/threonine protein phosphatase 1